ncbi:hypothetical protein AUP68_17051 [Ilyonectria robusta]
MLTQAGVTNTTTQLEINIILNAWCLVISIIGTSMANKLGRKKLAAFSTALLTIFIFLIGALTKVYGDSDNKSGIYATVAMIFLFQGSYSFGWTPLTVLYPPEVLNYSIRSVGMGIYTFLVNGVGLMVTFAFPFALEKIGWKTYMINGAWDVLELLFVILYWVETNGRTLEDIDNNLEPDSFPVVVGVGGKDDEIRGRRVSGYRVHNLTAGCWDAAQTLLRRDPGWLDCLAKRRQRCKIHRRRSFCLEFLVLARCCVQTFPIIDLFSFRILNTKPGQNYSVRVFNYAQRRPGPPNTVTSTELSPSPSTSALPLETAPSDIPPPNTSTTSSSSTAIPSSTSPASTFSTSIALPPSETTSSPVVSQSEDASSASPSTSPSPETTSSLVVSQSEGASSASPSTSTSPETTSSPIVSQPEDASSTSPTASSPPTSSGTTEASLGDTTIPAISTATGSTPFSSTTLPLAIGFATPNNTAMAENVGPRPRTPSHIAGIAVGSIGERQVTQLGDK